MRSAAPSPSPPLLPPAPLRLALPTAVPPLPPPPFPSPLPPAARLSRCLRAFALPLETALCVAFAMPGQDLEGHGEREVWEWEDDRPRPLDIAEEALIMAMPLSAKHEGSNACVEIGAPDEQEETTTPFASLRAQMDESN